jgi:hypothetical protein
MSLRKALLATCLSAAALAAAPAGAATTFFNDWESTDFGAGPGFTILPSYEGWTAGPGPGIEVQYNNVAGLPFSGENLVELDSTGNTQMNRNIDAGTYKLTFYYSPRPGIAAASNGIDVLVNGTSVFNVTGDGGGQTGWVLQTVNFSIGAPGVLSFAALGTSDSLGGYLEDVRLAVVPEPATWAMMLGGFGLLGAALRRRGAAKPVLA